MFVLSFSQTTPTVTTLSSPYRYFFCPLEEPAWPRHKRKHISVVFRCSWLKSVGLCVWNDLWLRLSVGVQVHAREVGGFGKREWGWVFPRFCRPFRVYRTRLHTAGSDTQICEQWGKADAMSTISCLAETTVLEIFLFIGCSAWLSRVESMLSVHYQWRLFRVHASLFSSTLHQTINSFVFHLLKPQNVCVVA